MSSVNNSYAGAVVKGFVASGVVGGGPGSADSRHDKLRTPDRRMAVPIATKVICRCVRRDACW
jgi:hypothetical protein